MANIQTQNILILAHPGHELRIHHWLELNRPRVYLLTDGSGGKGTSRTHFSRKIVEETGSICGSVFGELSDKTWYAALADKNFTFFHSVLARIEADLADGESFDIIADAVDGYNPVHDLASAMGVALQRRLIAAGRKATLAFSAAVPSASGDLVALLHLDEAARARKLKAIEGYTPLAEEARRILEQDSSAIDREYLIKQSTNWSKQTTPTWETIGRERVQAGTYKSCLTSEEHFLPIVIDLLAMDEVE